MWLLLRLARLNRGWLRLPELSRLSDGIWGLPTREVGEPPGLLRLLRLKLLLGLLLRKSVSEASLGQIWQE